MKVILKFYGCKGTKNPQNYKAFIAKICRNINFNNHSQ